jgi:hypothetical protein
MGYTFKAQCYDLDDLSYDFSPEGVDVSGAVPKAAGLSTTGYQVQLTLTAELLFYQTLTNTHTQTYTHKHTHIQCLLRVKAHSKLRK